jgi:hypothetical protein
MPAREKLHLPADAEAGRCRVAVIQLQVLYSGA